MTRRNDAVKLRPLFVDVMPEFDAIKAGELWISHKHRTVNLRCPCGCGDLTVLTLHPSRWHVHFDGRSVSLDGPTGGSVWAHSGCGSHYRIENNAVIWAPRIDPGRHSEYAKVERTRMMASQPSRSAPHSKLQRVLRLFLPRSWRR